MDRPRRIGIDLRRAEFPEFRWVRADDPPTGLEEFVELQPLTLPSPLGGEGTTERRGVGEIRIGLRGIAQFGMQSAAGDPGIGVVRVRFQHRARSCRAVSRSAAPGVVPRAGEQELGTSGRIQRCQGVVIEPLEQRGPWLPRHVGRISGHSAGRSQRVFDRLRYVAATEPVFGIGDRRADVVGVERARLLQVACRLVPALQLHKSAGAGPPRARFATVPCYRVVEGRRFRCAPRELAPPCRGILVQHLLKRRTVASDHAGCLATVRKRHAARRTRILHPSGSGMRTRSDTTQFALERLVCRLESPPRFVHLSQSMHSEGQTWFDPADTLIRP